MADRQVTLTDRQARILYALVDREFELSGGIFPDAWYREVAELMAGVTREELAGLQDALAGPG